MIKAYSIHLSLDTKLICPNEFSRIPQNCGFTAECPLDLSTKKDLVYFGLLAEELESPSPPLWGCKLKRNTDINIRHHLVIPCHLPNQNTSQSNKFCDRTLKCHPVTWRLAKSFGHPNAQCSWGKRCCCCCCWWWWWWWWWVRRGQGICWVQFRPPASMEQMQEAIQLNLYNLLLAQFIEGMFTNRYILHHLHILYDVHLQNSNKCHRIEWWLGTAGHAAIHCIRQRNCHTYMLFQQERSTSNAYGRTVPPNDQAWSAKPFSLRNLETLRNDACTPTVEKDESSPSNALSSQVWSDTNQITTWVPKTHAGQCVVATQMNCQNKINPL